MVDGWSVGVAGGCGRPVVVGCGGWSAMWVVVAIAVVDDNGGGNNILF